MARNFGVIEMTKDVTVSYPGIGGRNLAAGLAVRSLSLMEQRKALGTLLYRAKFILGHHSQWTPLSYRRVEGDAE